MVVSSLLMKAGIEREGKRQKQEDSGYLLVEATDRKVTVTLWTLPIHSSPAGQGSYLACVQG